jgi:hypothetical protein
MLLLWLLGKFGDIPLFQLLGRLGMEHASPSPYPLMIPSESLE